MEAIAISNPAKSQRLAMLSRARRALVAAKTLEEVVDIRNQAAAVARYFKESGEALAIQNDAIEVRLHAERKGGAILLIPGSHATGRPSKKESQPAILLSDLGISKDHSHRWQKLARIDEDDFNAHLESFKTEGKEITTAGLLRLAKAEPKPEKQWNVFDCTEQMRKYVETMWERWPADRQEDLVAQLRELADEIEETFTLTEDAA
jgi:hypothetical protein